MALRWTGWVCAIGLGSALPLHTRQTSNSNSNSHSAKIIAPVVIVAAVCVMLVAFGWWKRRKRTQDLIQQLQTPTAANNNNSATNATTQTTPTTGADAPARPPRRRRRRRPSQISTKSLPAYNEQAGDEEIVLVRRAQRRRDESDEEDDNENENENVTTNRPVTATNAPDSRPLLDDDSSPDMPRVSLASSTRNQSPNDHSQPQEQSLLGHESIAQTTTMASSIADTEPEPEPERTPAAAPVPPVPSYIEAMSTSHVNLPSTTETDHTAQPSTGTDYDPAVPLDADATVRPKRKSVFRHLGRFHINKPGATTSATESVEMSAPRTSTSTHRPSGSLSTHRPSTSLSTNHHNPSPSLSSLSLYLTRSQSPPGMSRTSLNISAPIHTTLVRTELNYPKAGPTPEQIRFLSSRESLGRFGMPYGDQAIAAARSREHFPPVYKPRTDGNASGSGAGPSGASGSGVHSTQGATEDEPTVTITRGPILLTPGELAQRQSENAASGGSDDHRPDSSVLDPAMTISEEPKAVDGEPEVNEDKDDSKSIRDQARESRGTPERPADTRGQDDSTVERESPHDDGRPRATWRESVMTTHSFVTATEGQGDSSPPTPTAETYHPARGQTVLIPESREALHPELTLVPATPIS